MKTDPFPSGPLGIPNGQVRVETPDGVSRTFQGGEVLNSLTNASYVGSDGLGYGAFPHEGDSGLCIFGGPPGSPDRIEPGKR